MKYIDDVLNKITMYRLVLYVVFGLIGAALLLCSYGLLPYSPVRLLFSVGYISLICIIFNWIFAKVFGVPANVESVYITAGILILIIAPPSSMMDAIYFSLATWASVWAVASKYIVAWNKKHIFNPVAFGVAITALTLGQSANWWVGTSILMPYVLVGGLLVVRKVMRSDLVYACILVAVATILASKFILDSSMLGIAWKIFTNTPLLFFAFIMLTEPLTTPPRAYQQMIYGALVGLLFAPQMHIGPLYTTPELALLIGNIFVYIVSPKQRLVLTLTEKNKHSSDLYDFVFTPDQSFKFQAGQYVEWTLGHQAPDTRGNRRYFTLASSPTESSVHLGVKFYPNSSTFKKTLSDMNIGDTVSVSQIAGEFTLPKSIHTKLVFIAGGIGVTPFRSMVQYMIDTGEKRNVHLLYSARTENDLIYKDIFDQAIERIGLVPTYVVNEYTKGDTVPHHMRTGFIDGDLIKSVIPDYTDRVFYISGPHGMVTAFETTLKQMGIKKDHIRTDFFPGFV